MRNCQLSYRRCAALLTLSVLVSPSPQASASALSDLVSQMSAGEWRELSTLNINPTFIAGGASGIANGYSEDLVWDPVSRQTFFVGGDHGDQPQFITYVESSNTWQRLPRQSWMNVTNTPMHGYDHGAIDPAGRAYYFRPYGDRIVHRYNISSGVWTDLPNLGTSVMAYNNCCVGVEWFPERSSLVYASVESGTNGSIVEFASGQWRRLHPTPSLPMGEYHHFAEYDPVHKVMLFGGGNGANSRKIHKLSASGQITALRDAPIGLGIMGSIVTVDTLSGDYLVFGDDRSFYSYNVVTDTWTSRSATGIPIWTTQFGNPVFGVLATPVSTYGVNLFVRCDGSNDCRVFLYKYSPGSAPTTPNAPTAVVAQ